MAFNRRIALAGVGAAAVGTGYWALRQPETGSGHSHVPPPGVFLVGNGGEPESLDPALAQSVIESNIMGDLMVGLMDFDPDTRPIPGMAINWRTTPDGLTWTFALRQALWSDGMPVTAQDFVFSWRRILDPRTAAGYAYFLYVIKNASAVNAGKMPASALGVRAIDDRTLEISLEHPAPYLLEMLTHATMYPEPRHLVESKGKEWTRAGTYVGNGAYRLVEWVPNGHITLVRNPHFYDAANVAMDRVVYYPTADYGAALRQLRAGELDVQFNLPREEIGWIKANMPELLSPLPELILDLLTVNHKFAPFDDIRVRRAMNLAINREVIADKIVRSGFVPAYAIVPPGTANYPGGVTLDFLGRPYPQCLDEAQALMRAAGLGPAKRVATSLMIRSTAAGNYRAVAAAIQQMFALIYIDAAIISNDVGVFYDTIQQHNFQIAQAGWAADFDDASNFLDLFRTGSGNNWGQYSDPAFDTAMNSAQNQTELGLRGTKLAVAEAIALKDQAAIPLFFWTCPNLVRPYVKGWKANPLDFHRSRWISIDQNVRRATLI